MDEGSLGLNRRFVGFGDFEGSDALKHVLEVTAVAAKEVALVISCVGVTHSSRARHRLASWR